MNRLTDEQLSWLEKRTNDECPPQMARYFVAALAELKSRRAADVEFTSDDIEALVQTIDDVTRMDSLDDDGGPKTSEVRRRAIALLQRLTASGGSR